MVTRHVANMNLSTAAHVTATAPASLASLIYGPTAIRRISSGTQTTVPLPTNPSTKHSLKSTSKFKPALSTSSFPSKPPKDAARPPNHAKPHEEQNPTTLEPNKRNGGPQQDNRSNEAPPSSRHTLWDGNDDDRGGPLCFMRTMLGPEESWVLPDPIPQVKPGKLADEWSGEPVGRSGGGKRSRGPGEESPNQAGDRGTGGLENGAMPPPIANSGISEAFTFSGVDEAVGGDGSSSRCGSPVTPQADVALQVVTALKGLAGRKLWWNG